MKKLTFRISWCVMIAIMLGACQEYEPLAFSEISLRPIENPGQVGKLSLRANILNDLVLDSVGFMWSTSLEDVNGAQIGGQYVYVPPEEVIDGEFEITLDDLSVDTTYYFRAFAIDVDKEAGSRLIFSPEIRNYNFNINLIMLEDFTIMNNQAAVSAVLTGVENANLSIAEHGFEYAPCCSIPCQASASCFESPDSTTIGAVNDDGVLLDTLNDLAFNTTYLVRAWATKASGEKFYSNIVEMQIKDGWRQVESLPVNLTEAAATANEQFGFVTLGKTDLSPGIRTVYQFDPANENWAVFEPSDIPECFLFETKSGIAFWLDDALHAGQGTLNDAETLNGVATFDFANNCWEYLDYPSELPRKKGAVSFVVDGKAYIGAGSNYNNMEYYNDFWQYDPLANTWMEVAALPFKSTAGAPADEGVGRREAVSFVYKGKAYVGSGFAEGVGVAGDFWTFIPPDEAPPIGAWEYVAHFEGRDRSMAVAMVINDRVYFGTGEDADVFTLNDWWEFVPESAAWIARAPMPALPRAQAVAFAVDKRGFVGAGLARLLGGNAFYTQELSDFWEYIPAE